MPTLYQPEKYRVHVGGGTSLGFCTAWNEPELIFKRYEGIRNNTALLGTLYSRQGVSVILRNLALNPEIRKVYLWANGSLSNTEFGKSGWTLLKAVWENGVEADGTVKGTKFKIEKEIAAEVVEKIRTSVELLDMSAESLDDLEEKLTDAPKAEPYMEPVSFPDAVAEKVDVFPSEEVGFLIRGTTVLSAWLRVIDRIMRYGTIKGTQYGMKQRELIGVTWVVSNEDPTRPDLSLASDWPEELRDLTGTTEKAITQYHAVFLSPDPPTGVAYTYGNRLMKYPIEPLRDSQAGPSATFDQIKDVIIKQLKDSPDSRRAVATTMVPAIDKDSKEPPCITQIQGIQSGGKLHFLVTNRSHDIMKAAIPNAFGLRMLQKTVADELGFALGKLQITSQSAHIYEGDWEQALKLVRCAFWERTPSLVFDPTTSADPRGMVVITLEAPEIVATVQSFEGAELAKIRGRSAAEVGLKIAHLDLLSRADHYFDIGLQLSRAEIALAKKITFHQDKPLIF